jgi:tetratricopeptide (TPR) repeat protein
MLTMLALAAIWCALHDLQRRSWWLVAASAAYGLAVGARPSLLFGAVILLVPVMQAWRAAAETGSHRRVLASLVAATGPIMLIGLGLMLYNLLRFDSPLEFGQHYQLVPQRQTEMDQFSLGYLWYNFRFGFLAPAPWGSLFPFVEDIVVPPLPKGYIAEHAFGVLTNIPVVWLAPAAVLAWRSRIGEARSTLRWFLAAIALFFGTCAVSLSLHFSMCLRYELEFTFPLVWLAVAGILGLERTLAGQPVRRRAARWCWGLLLAFSVAFNLLAGFLRQADTHHNLGSALLQRGHADEAMDQFQKALEINPRSAGAHNNLGVALLAKGQVSEAITHLQQAVAINPRYAEAHYNLGNALVQEGRTDEAIAQYTLALEIKPDYAKAHYHLGNLFLQEGKGDEAIAQYTLALEIKPDYAQAHYQLGRALLQQNDSAGAIPQFENAVEIEPGYVQARDNLGSLLLLKGRADEAIVQFQKILELQPNHVSALNNLAWIRAANPADRLRDGAEAVRLAERACRVTEYKVPMVVGTLAAAYAEAGRFDEAAATAEKARELALGLGQKKVADKNAELIQGYRNRQPYREPAR